MLVCFISVSPAQELTQSNPNIFIGINAGHVGLICCGGAGGNIAYRLSNRPFEFGGGFRYVQSDGEAETEIGDLVVFFTEFYGYAGARIPLGTRFSLLADFTLGAMSVRHPDVPVDSDQPLSSSGPSFGIRAGVGFSLTDNWELYIKASGATIPTMFTAIDAAIGLNYGWRRISLEQSGSATGLQVSNEDVGDIELVRLTDVAFKEVFPVHYKQYRNESIGEVTVYNGGSTEVSDVRLELFVRRFMDDPQQVFVADTIGAQEQIRVSLNALLTEDVLAVTEGTRVTARVAILYSRDSKAYRAEETAQIRVLHRNATTWDDDRRVCAFVTARDPMIMQFSKQVASWIQQVPVTGLDSSILGAIAIHEALVASDIRYIIDPDSSYIELSRSDSAVDFLQFPRQTFNFNAGDCDDLSALYAAMLEAIGIETAFITIPGHIFIAAKLAGSNPAARESLVGYGDLIVRENELWIPLETTMRDAGFTEIWSRGAKQWGEHNASGTAGFFRTHEAWKVYEPVGFAEGGSVSKIPDRSLVVDAYQDTVERLIRYHISEEVDRLQHRISQNESPRDRNALGVLYASFGLYGQAEPEFSRALELSPESFSALMNLGHIEYLSVNIDAALLLYERAFEVSPENPRVMLAIARANHELENYGITRRYYEDLRKADPDLADEYAYLELRSDQATRSSAFSALINSVPWEGNQ